MPPDGYLKSAAIESGLSRLHSTYPSFTELIKLPEQSVEECTIRTIRIRSGEGQPDGVLLIGGTHARELINPDLLLGLAWKLCFAYANGLGLNFGAPKKVPTSGPAGASLAPSGPGDLPGKRYSADEIRRLVEGLDIFIVPNINPDGREYVRSHYEEEWDWRKNRSRNSDGSFGTDLNRNYDFLWNELIGSTSSTQEDDNYHGCDAFSEPETRNVRWLLGSYPDIMCLADIHSYAEAILHPWSDADNQSNVPSMNFRNPYWNGRREEPGYGEYMPAVDEFILINRGQRVADAIAAVGGRRYAVGQSLELPPPLGYPSSGSSKDYAYSRHFLGPARKVWAYTVETNRSDRGIQYGYSPPYEDALAVMEEVQAGLIQFMLDCLCVIREVGRQVLERQVLDELAQFRDSEMLTRRRGKRWTDLLDRHSTELLGLLLTDAHAWQAAEQVLVEAADIVHARDNVDPPVLARSLVARIEHLATRLERNASPEFRKFLKTIRKDANSVVGKTARQAIR
jgi:murein tripeptide amidase MpaA